MFKNEATLHLLVGKISAGKSTLASKLGRSPATVVISEDEWLATLFGEEMHSVSDYVRFSSRLRLAMEPHLISLLQSDISVVLDFAANTVDARAWMREVFEKADCDHRLHFLDVPDDVCRARLCRRNAVGDHPFTVSDEQFDFITGHFVAPSAEERFQVITYRHDES